MKREAAETTAVQALVFLAGREEALGAFLDAAGADASELRARAQDPEFLGFVMDFMLQDEVLLLAFCDDQGLPYDLPMRARSALPGGDLPHWT